MSAITFIRASQLAPFVDAMRHVGAPVEDCLSRAGLAPDLLNDPERVIPEAPLWLLAQQVGEMMALPWFGFVVAEMGSLRQLGTFGTAVCSSSSLGKAIAQFVELLPKHQSSPPFWTTRTRREIWLHRRGPPNMPGGHWQIEQYVVSVMVQLIRLATHPDWTPSQVHLQAVDTVGIERATVLRNSRIFVGRESTAISVPLGMLRNSLHRPIDGVITHTLAISPSLAENLSHYIQRMLELGPPPGLNEVSAQLCMSSRTLQRHLGAEGVSYSNLLEAACRRRAVEALTTSDIAIGQLASELGYSDPAHFTRAFRRWEDCTPREFTARYRLAKQSSSG